MAKVKKRKKAASSPPSVTQWWADWTEQEAGAAARLFVNLAFVVLLICGVGYFMRALEGYVLAQRGPAPEVTLVLRDVPTEYQGRPAREILARAQSAARTEWSDEALVEKIGRAVAAVGWVKRVKRIEKLYDGQVLVDCEYRTGAAMVEAAGRYYLIDREGYRLPGEYARDDRYGLIEGVRAPLPPPGRRWEGDDVAAGLAMLELVQNQPFRDQISGVSVRNFRGEIDPRQSHLVLLTRDPKTGRPGGRIRWGSALGEEIEEPTPAEKLETLRANYQRFSRVDGNKPWIDVSARRGGYLYPDASRLAAE